MYQIAPGSTACSFFDFMRVVRIAPDECCQPKLLNANGIMDLIGELDLSL